MVIHVPKSHATWCHSFGCDGECWDRGEGLERREEIDLGLPGPDSGWIAERARLEAENRDLRAGVEKLRSALEWQRILVKDCLTPGNEIALMVDKTSRDALAVKLPNETIRIPEKQGGPE